VAIRLTEILDLPILQAMFDSLWRASGIPMGLFDANGDLVYSTGWQKLCTDYHLRHPEIGPRCILNCMTIPPPGADDETAVSPHQTTCSSGLIDITLPIWCEGEYIGLLFLGQFLDHPPDRQHFRIFAEQSGFDPDEYLVQLEVVPVIPREKIDHFLDFHAALIRLLSAAGVRKLREERIRQSLQESEQALRDSEERFRGIVQATPLGIHMYQCDAAGRLIFTGYNPAADAILGVDNSRFLGKELLEAFPALAGTEVPDRYLQVCTQGEAWQAEQVDYVDGNISGAFEVHVFRTGPNRIASVFMNVGEQRRALEAIRASEATLRSILTAAPLSIGLGQERVFSWVNRWMLEMLGYAEEELVGHNARMLYENEAEFERIGEVRAATVDQGRMGETETRWLRRDGTAIDVFLRFVRIEPEDPSKGVIFTALNISAAKRAAAELHEREARIRLLLESSGEAIFGADVDGCCTFVNAMCLELLGYNQESELLGRPLHDLIHCSSIEHPHRGESECKIFGALRDGEAVHVVGEMFWRRDGSSFVAEYWSSPMLKDGEVVGAVVNFIDITERQLAERRLRDALAETQQAREQVNAILRSVADALIVIDPRGRILMVNPAATELIGAPVGKIIGARIAEKLPDQAFLDRIGRAIAGTEVSSVFDLSVWRGSNGRERILQARVATIEVEQQGLYGAVAILRDVTREREIERLKDDFISTAAHELRTPITSILGYTEIMLDQLKDLTPEQLQEFLGVVYNRSEALAQIVAEMLDLSRMQSGQVIHLCRQLGDLGQLAREVVSHYQVANDGHSFRLAVAESLQPLEFDAAKLRQVFDNLISNAFKFSPPESEITITVEDQANEVVTTVTDQGIGMTPEQVERVFDKFYRADASATAISGLGLGMSLVRGIIEGHGGRIWVTSAPGRGTTVSFTLPGLKREKG
jgi:PAS domain S-box-containing protein